jgi:hypothetical protein
MPISLFNANLFKLDNLFFSRVTLSDGVSSVVSMITDKIDKLMVSKGFEL